MTYFPELKAYWNIVHKLYTPFQTFKQDCVLVLQVSAGTTLEGNTSYFCTVPVGRNLHLTNISFRLSPQVHNKIECFMALPFISRETSP
jgi:hypothetical protein